MNITSSTVDTHPEWVWVYYTLMSSIIVVTTIFWFLYATNCNKFPINQRMPRLVLFYDGLFILNQISAWLMVISPNMQACTWRNALWTIIDNIGLALTLYRIFVLNIRYAVNQRMIVPKKTNNYMITDTAAYEGFWVRHNNWAHSWSIKICLTVGIVITSMILFILSLSSSQVQGCKPNADLNNTFTIISIIWLIPICYFYVRFHHKQGDGLCLIRELRFNIRIVIGFTILGTLVDLVYANDPTWIPIKGFFGDLVTIGGPLYSLMWPVLEARMQHPNIVPKHTLHILLTGNLSFRASLHSFLLEEYAGENTMFIDAVDKLKIDHQDTINTKSLIADVITIYNTYILQSGERTINISSPLYDELKKKVGPYLTDTHEIENGFILLDVFDDARDAICTMLTNDSLQRFYRSKKGAKFNT